MTVKDSALLTSVEDFLQHPAHYFAVQIKTSADNGRLHNGDYAVILDFKSLKNVSKRDRIKTNMIVKYDEAVEKDHTTAKLLRAEVLPGQLILHSLSNHLPEAPKRIALAEVEDSPISGIVAFTISEP